MRSLNKPLLPWPLYPETSRYILSAISATCLQMTRTCAAVFPGFRAGLCQAPWWLVYCISPLLGVNRDVVHVSTGHGVRGGECRGRQARCDRE